jgi:hypothetical protein
MTRPATGSRYAQARDRRVEALRRIRILANEIEAAGLPSAMVAHWFVQTVRDFDDAFMAGHKPDLHRLLDLPRGRGPRARRQAFLEARDAMLRRIAATFPADLAPWTRARRVLELVHGTEPATGDVALLRQPDFAKYLPESVRQVNRILRR